MFLKFCKRFLFLITAYHLYKLKTVKLLNYILMIYFKIKKIQKKINDE